MKLFEGVFILFYNKRATFTGLDNDAKIGVVLDLMRIAGLDSVIRIDRAVTICGVDMTAPNNETDEEKADRLYKENFYDFIMPFVIQNLRIVEKYFIYN